MRKGVIKHLVRVANIYSNQPKGVSHIICNVQPVT